MAYAFSPRGMARASLAAGPSFVLLVDATALYLKLPAPIGFSAGQLAALLFLALFAAPLGFFLALPLVALGGSLMSLASERFSLARLPIIWIGAGALAGFALTAILPLGGSSPEVTVGLMGTSAACAWICRAYSGI
jgi:hypothetical protein